MIGFLLELPLGIFFIAYFSPIEIIISDTEKLRFVISVYQISLRSDNPNVIHALHRLTKFLKPISVFGNSTRSSSLIKSSL